jgi:hypothetical protein
MISLAKLLTFQSALSRAKEPLPQQKRKKSKKKKKPPENRKPPHLPQSNGISRDNSNEALLKGPDTPIEYSKDVEMTDVAADVSSIFNYCFSWNSHLT